MAGPLAIGRRRVVVGLWRVRAVAGADRRHRRRTMHLTIIAKTPEPGRVKTRLCPSCTAKQAAEIAAAALADTVDAIDATVGVSPWVGLVRRVLLLDGRRTSGYPTGTTW